MPLEPENYEVYVTGDQMEAYFTLKSEVPGLSVSDIAQALQRSGVVAGVDETRLRELAAKPPLGAPQLVARGYAAVDGTSEQITYHFDVDMGTNKVTEDDAGSIDFRSLKNFLNIEAGSLLAEKTSVVPGKPGRNVLGQDLPAREGRTTAFKFGKGVEVTTDGLKAIAQVDGHPAIIADRLTVLNTVEVPSHVDYSIGNIDFIGNVKVRGDVMPGFAVKTRGNLEIAGNVEQANLDVGGNLDLRGIIFGQGNSKIMVKGDARIGAIDQAEVHVHGHLKVNNYIRHSTVLVGASLELIGQKGNVIGGEISAFQGISCPYAGNAMATLTKLTVGVNPFAAVELDDMVARYNDLDGKLRQINAAIMSSIQRGNTSMLDRLKQMQVQLEPVHKQLGEQLELMKMRTAENKDARIKIKEKVFPGVVVNFRNKLQYKTMDEAQRLSFYEEGAEIRTGPY
jgi:uncharacterized protein